MEIPLLPDIVKLFCLSIGVLLVCHKIRIPPIVGFLLTGVLCGPTALGLVENIHAVELLSEVGVVLLLFTIGMEMSGEELAAAQTDLRGRHDSGSADHSGIGPDHFRLRRDMAGRRHVRLSCSSFLHGHRAQPPATEGSVRIAPREAYSGSHDLSGHRRRAHDACHSLSGRARRRRRQSHHPSAFRGAHGGPSLAAAGCSPSM